jgi:hypothetical protein
VHNLLIRGASAPNWISSTGPVAGANCNLSSDKKGGEVCGGGTDSIGSNESSIGVERLTVLLSQLVLNIYS